MAGGDRKSFPSRGLLSENIMPSKLPVVLLVPSLSSLRGDPARFRRVNSNSFILFF